MHTTLTEKDVIHLKKTIARLEKNIRGWPKVRWFLLLFGLICFALGLYRFLQLEELRSALETVSDGALKNNELAALIENILRPRVELLNAELNLGFSSILYFIVSGMLFGATVAYWNRMSTDLAQVVLLRTLIESPNESPNKSLNTEAGDAGSG